jgi:putative hydrolase of the HAD superfamily
MQQQFSTLLDIPNFQPFPQVIFLDAFGTLFGVRGSVGQIYSEIASRYGVNCQPELLNKYFYTAFKNSTPGIFPGVPAADIPQHEYQWWREINRQTFVAAGVWAQFADFDVFFQDLYRYFTTASAWEIYPDTIPALEQWAHLGIQLAVLSNFDSRLYTVLKVLGLNKYFSTVTISTEISAAKPQSEIFIAALNKHQCQPELAWHIGDSFEEDYVGATNVGITAIWLNRA